MSTLLLIPLVTITVCIIHEGGHYLAALILTKKKLRFRFSLGWLCGKLPVPRFIWTMPWTPDKWRRKVIALAGFGLELSTALVLLIIDPLNPCFLFYAIAAVLHLLLYRLYAGEASDFKWLR